MTVSSVFYAECVKDFSMPAFPVVCQISAHGVHMDGISCLYMKMSQTTLVKAGNILLCSFDYTVWDQSVQMEWGCA